MISLYIIIAGGCGGTWYDQKCAIAGASKWHHIRNKSPRCSCRFQFERHALIFLAAYIVFFCEDHKVKNAKLRSEGLPSALKVFMLFCPSWYCTIICCIIIFTSLCKNLFNLLEFLAEDFRCHVHHFQCLTVFHRDRQALKMMHMASKSFC